MNLIKSFGLRAKFAVLLSWISLILVVTLFLSYQAFSPISSDWQNYQDRTVVRQELLLKIESAFGYGNMIHNFKNYVLRGDEKYYSRVKKSSAEITQAVKQYQQLGGLSGNEAQALKDIEGVNQKYNGATDKVQGLISAGKNIAELDGAVKVSDKKAIEGFTTLKQVYRQQIKASSSNLRTTMSSASYTMFIGIILSGLLIIGSILWMVSSLRCRILDLKQQICKAAHNRDLTVKIKIDSQDEISQTGEAFNLMLENFQDIVTTINDASTQLYDETQSLNNSNRQAQDNIAEQRQETEQVSTAITQTSRSIEEVAKNAQQASLASKQAEQEIAIMSDIQSLTVDSFRVFSGEVQSASTVISELQDISDKVGEVVGVIGSIADQTNLLALNAAIEAARAGESGRGFAVVADEVRTLAHRTQESTSEIDATMTELQNRSKHAVSVMQGSSEKAERSIGQMQEGESALNKVTQSIAHIAQLNVQIAAAAEQQAYAVAEVNNSTQSIRNKVEEVNQNTEQVSQSAKTVNQCSETLMGKVSEFKI